MTIKNNTKNFVVLQVKNGIRVNNFKIKPNEIIDIASLIDIKQVVNKFLFTKNVLSIIETSKEGEMIKQDIIETLEESESIKSKVEEAIENADNFVSDNEETLETAPLKTKKGKNKNE